LEWYSRESGIGKLFHFLNGRLRKVKSIRAPTRAELVRAVTESCGDLAPFVRLVWEGLNFEFRETAMREVVLYRGVELPEAALESYRCLVGRMFTWSMFSSFTEEREEAEERGRAWRGGVPVLFELRSAWCRRLRNGIYLLHPFAVLQVEAVVGNAVKLVEVELVEPGLVAPLPAQRPGVIPKGGRQTELHAAAAYGDVRTIARLATRPELIDGRDAGGWTPLAYAASDGKTEAVKALAALGADVNVQTNGGATPVYVAAQDGHLEVVKALASLGADVNVPDIEGATPVMVAAQQGYLEVVNSLASIGANVKIPKRSGATAVYFAAQSGHLEVVKALVSVGADVDAPMNDGSTPVFIAACQGHLEVVKALASLGAKVDAPTKLGVTPIRVAAQQGHLEVVKALSSLGASLNVAKGGDSGLSVA
jgi:ankyrin repeat protein